ncbi:hypothetical protein X742_01450 [Mesorhizobium sp. LNHC232B00]|nr:hypothetical protein X742_01450 [Mesorhizobium sp. LNHC232B00]
MCRRHFTKNSFVVSKKLLVSVNNVRAILSRGRRLAIRVDKFARDMVDKLACYHVAKIRILASEYYKRMPELVDWPSHPVEAIRIRSAKRKVPLQFSFMLHCNIKWKALLVGISSGNLLHWET